LQSVSDVSFCALRRDKNAGARAPAFLYSYPHPGPSHGYDTIIRLAALQTFMHYDTLANADSINTVIEALKEHNIETEAVDTRAAALARVKELIPAGASVMNGSSRTLEEIGFIDYLKAGEHGWNNLHAAVAAEKDPTKQTDLRRQSLFADYYLGSVHAATETGELIIASASGSQLAHLVSTSPNIVLVAGAQKIVPTLEDGLKRVREYVFLLEDARMKALGYPGSLLAKIVIFANELPMMGRKVHVLLVNEKLGF
jgi:hypothetical protein